jgi:hypothetical protein
MHKFSEKFNLPDNKTKINEDKLIGYIKVPNEEWDKIPVTSHIRYLTINDEFRTGGFVDRHGEKNGNKYIVLRPGLTKDIKTFVVYLYKVKTVWKKIHKETFNEFNILKKQIKIIDGFLLLKFGPEYKNYIDKYV